MGIKASSKYMLLLGLGIVLIWRSVSVGVVSARSNQCQAIVTRAMNFLQAHCDAVGRNMACYGHVQVKAEPQGSSPLRFDAAGDRVGIRDVRRLVTFPLDEKTGMWGMSLLKIQANVPDSVPGQNITFLVVGETSIENTSGNMRSFYFTTGLGNVNCQEAPYDSIIVRSPRHNEVTFTANGVQITIGSTIVLRAERNRAMTVELIEGHAKVAAAGGTQVLKPGEMVTVGLGGANGLTAISAPSAPVKVNAQPPAPILTLADKLSDPDAPASIAIQGCVSAVRGNMVEINGYQLDASQDRTLRNAKVGDCLQVRGRLELDSQSRVIWIRGSVNVVNNVNAVTGNVSNTSGTTPRRPRPRVTVTPIAIPTVVSLPALPVSPPRIPTLPPVLP